MTRLLGILFLLVTPLLAEGANIDQVNLAKDANFLLRVQYVIVASAISVRSESVGTTNHALRSAWAGLVLGNPPGYAALMAFGFVTQAPVAGSAICTTNPGGFVSCTTTATDAQLQTISDSLWNDYAVQ